MYLKSEYRKATWCSVELRPSDCDDALPSWRGGAPKKSELGCREESRRAQSQARCAGAAAVSFALGALLFPEVGSFDLRKIWAGAVQFRERSDSPNGRLGIYHDAADFRFLN
jgi:hypothetical protein